MFVCKQKCTFQQTSQQAEADNHEGGPCQSFYYAQFPFIQHSPWLAFAHDQPVLVVCSADGVSYVESSILAGQLLEEWWWWLVKVGSA